MKVGLIQAGMTIKERAQELAPELTGQMTRSVTVGQPHRAGGRMVVDIGPRTAYAKYTEIPKYIRQRPGMGAISRAKGATKPWLRPALKERRAEAVEILRGALGTALRGIAGSGART